ncbi:hypothetical protein AZI86_09780 [Bdellovibrio bacteriovorus]|uniref:Uncharacterized protein n=1 Tax=Bdellovibrio bacteriovorus TaxID=959 RepID=A0A150WS68_BDEBC|nr:DUF4421 family protein [Bdellovibrio bacteriovorus]KYG67280.1 hypothetical protein AZI86_09780 [Bdellovibrio bacteriovorus]
MSLLKRFLFLILLAVSATTFAEETKSTQEILAEEYQSQETPFWEPQKSDQLKVKTGFSVPRYSVEFDSPNKTKAKFEPNANSKVFLNLGYRNLSATASTTQAQSHEDESTKGSSDGTDFQFRLYGKRTYEFFYQSYHGYYLDNSAELDPAYVNTDKKILYPHLKTQNYGMNFFWNLDDEEFSFAVAFDQAGHQRKNALGWSVFGHASQSKITNGNQSLIPASAAPTFGSLADITDINRFTLAGGAGFGAILIFKEKYYATGLLALGLGYQDAQFKSTDGGQENKKDLGTYSTLRMGAGYNGQKHVVGLQVLAERVGSNVGDGEIGGTLAELSLAYSYRFDSVSLPPLDVISSWLD